MEILPEEWMARLEEGRKGFLGQAAVSRRRRENTVAGECTLTVMRRVATKGLDSLPKRKAEFTEPMECAPVSPLPDGSNWALEIKLDGYRAVAVKSDRGVNLFSRRHKSFNHQYPHLVEALGELPDGTIVDDEPPETARYQTYSFEVDPLPLAVQKLAPSKTI